MKVEVKIYITQTENFISSFWEDIKPLRGFYEGDEGVNVKYPLALSSCVIFFNIDIDKFTIITGKDNTVKHITINFYTEKKYLEWRLLFNKRMRKSKIEKFLDE